MSEAVTQFGLELGDAELKPGSIINWLYDYFRDLRQRPKSGLYLGTVHSAKGLEFPHVAVLEGDWSVSGQPVEEERRLYYVAMTRAINTLTLCEFKGTDSHFVSSLRTQIKEVEWNGSYKPELKKTYRTLSLAEIDIGYPGSHHPTHAIHDRIKAVKPGDPLHFSEHNEIYDILDKNGAILGRTSRSFTLTGRLDSADIAIIAHRFIDDGDEQYRSRYKSERWEIIVPRVVLTK
ncbi:3'-5' exonuclease [Nitrincola sp. A-D6]|uniref:3'-5' exonuclease n=1 Tax=Nitrincola sp. A-D6 TaxID=1545442 RepID=UPI001361F77D|nr:3'-5' exonuclease [Nitrincola sp. A-D6]